MELCVPTFREAIESAVSVDLKGIHEKIKNVKVEDFDKAEHAVFGFVGSTMGKRIPKLAQATVDLCWLFADSYTVGKFSAALNTVYNRFEDSFIRCANKTPSAAVASSTLEDNLHTKIGRIVSSVHYCESEMREMYIFILSVLNELDGIDSNKEALAVLRSTVKHPLVDGQSILESSIFGYAVGGIVGGLFGGIGSCLVHAKHSIGLDETSPLLSDEFHNACVTAIKQNNKTAIENLINNGVDNVEKQADR
jgi:hypothetical protein